ncbi:MAG: GNAT family N-acetyltransferase [Bacteroidetes bacterium]|nr:GNAT family N-acetyltransferase [Bacteroidota bacterium]
MELKFKKATEQDVTLIAQLADNIWRRHYITIITLEQIEFMLKTMYSSESLLKQMKDGHQFTLVYDGAKAIGYIALSTKDAKNYFLHKFYVEVDDQRKGVGSDLFKYVLSQMPTAETIELTVNRQNFKAINFYFKKGFVIKEIADFDIGNGYFMNDFIMINKLK